MAGFLQWAQLIVLLLATFFGFRALREAQSIRRERDRLASDLAAEHDGRSAWGFDRHRIDVVIQHARVVETLPGGRWRVTYGPHDNYVEGPDLRSVLDSFASTFGRLESAEPSREAVP